MRRRLLICVLVCIGYALQAQKPMSIKIKDPVICYASTKNNPHYVAPPEEYLNRKNKAARTNAADIQVHYIGFEGVPQAQAAFDKAIQIWGSLLESSVPIHVEARWVPLAAGVLGSANYASAYANFDGAQKINVFYPVAIAEKITGREMNGVDEPDIVANFSSVFDWHYDSNTTPPVGKYDLTTVVLHELGHGLGFSGTLRVSGGNGLFGLASTGAPIIYDVPIETFAGANLLETIASPSTAMAAPLTSNSLFFDAPSGTSKLYAPTTYNGGSSVSHLDETLYDNTPNSLMTPFIDAREQINHPGLSLEILQDLGWETIVIKHQKLIGTESLTGPFPVTATIAADNGYDASSVTLHFTKNGGAFTTVQMTPSGPAHTFSANITPSGAGVYQYFISVKNQQGVEYVKPGKGVRPLNTQLQYVNAFRVGTDNRPPKITHEQQPFLLDSDTELVIEAEIVDDLGSVTAEIEYLINNDPKSPIPLTLLAPETDSLYRATIDISALSDGDQIKYRIKATDPASSPNTGYAPATGYYTLSVVGLGEIQDSYENDFETPANDSDFFGTGYSITKPAGFTNRAIHSEHPYTNGDGLPGNERNLIYQLRIPIRVQGADAFVKFDEIALMEVGAPGAVFGDEDFFDYVIVEGSKDGGQTWEYLVPGYDAQSQAVWLTRYNSAIDADGNSTATGDPTLYRPRVIDLLDKFDTGDAVVIRFRTYIDQLANAWGWSIDNLKIQIDEDAPKIYHNHLDYLLSGVDLPKLDVKVTDLSGIESVVLNFRLNTDEVTGTLTATELVTGQTVPFDFPVEEFSEGDVLEYSVTATDAFGNSATLPESGYIKVPYFTPAAPIAEYTNNFNSETTDFIGNFFSIGTPAGFSNGALQTYHVSQTDFYPVGFGMESTSDFTFTLKKPITISASNPIIRFDEIALVATDDYVTVEGSKDNGQTWTSFIDEYDASAQTVWNTAVNNAAQGTSNMFRTRGINMKESGDFVTGDEVLIRFRLFINDGNSAWGWAIDNLYIQNVITGVENLSEPAVSVFPNPSQGNFTVEAESLNAPEFSIELISAQGQKIYQATEAAKNGKMMHTIVSQGFPSGMYVIKITNGSKSTMKKIIKN